MAVLGLVAAPGAQAQTDDIPEPVTILDAFDDTLPGEALITYNGPGGGAFADVFAPPSPSALSGGNALLIATNTPNFAGMLRQFVVGGQWQPVDASAAEGFGFSFLGTGDGTAMFLDVLDNRAPGSDTDTAGRWSVSFVDDQVGWRELFWTWDEFAQKNVGNGAPDDGFGLEEINGWGVGSLGTGGTDHVVWVDDVSVGGTRPLTVGFTPPITRVAEGATAEVTVALSRVSDADITLAWATSDSTDVTASEDVVATPGRDYAPASGTVTIPAGEKTAIIRVPGLQDDEWEVDESYQVVLTDTGGLPDGPSTRGVVSLADDDPREPDLIEDGAEPGLLEATRRATVDVVQVAPGSADARPGQQYTEDVVVATGNGAVGRSFAGGEDFSGSDGLSLWFKGSGRQAKVDVTVLDGSGEVGDPEDWELVFSDEFDGPAGSLPDPDKWSYETGGWGWGNQELQYYTEGADVASLDGQGNLVITTAPVEDPEAAGLPCWYGDCEYTSARLVTEGKAEFQYGRIEARLKAPAGDGIWPAFWSLGEDFRDVGWPATGEIDFYEFVGREPNEVFGTVHGPGYSGGQSFGGTITTDVPVPEEFHTLEVVWQPELIEWYFDGTKFHEATPADVAPNDWPFEKPFTLLLNQALGGNFGGPLGADLELPAEFLVDHVRVYSTPDTAQRWTASFRDTAGWQQVTIPWSQFRLDGKQPQGAERDGLELTDVEGWTVESPGNRGFLLDEVTLAR